ncbi:MAG: PEP-CTERM sorting domain-containing protein [Pirellulales bacterium]|nr:PEP-CTERM sorting domain-containing protein [Pirellulales bacterium]
MRKTMVAAATLLLLATLGAPFASAEWIPLVKLDILDDGNAGETFVEDGFTGWAPKVTGDADPPPTSTTIEGITISFDVGAYQQDRFRTLPANTPATKMYQDTFWGRAADLNDKGLDITLSGLTAGQPYLVALYAYDYADWNGTQSCDWTANGEFAFNISWYAEDDDGLPIDLPTSLDTFKRTVVVEADGNGEILLVSSPGTGVPSTTYWANCSGLEIYGVPEPGMIVSLLGAVFAGLMIRRRK